MYLLYTLEEGVVYSTIYLFVLFSKIAIDDCNLDSHVTIDNLIIYIIL